MGFKFEDLEVWKLALEYTDSVYEMSSKLPREEDFILKSQIRRAATSIALNIAEGSTGQTDSEQARFLGLALRSLVETVACLRLMQKRRYLATTDLDRLDKMANGLAAKLQAFRKAIAPDQKWLREEQFEYGAND
jgi:four helix bundle protein